MSRTEEELKEDTRYPYTYACDFLRMKVDPMISRSQASQLREIIAEVIGMDDEELAKKLADFYLKHQEQIEDERFKKVRQRLMI